MSGLRVCLVKFSHCGPGAGETEILSLSRVPAFYVGSPAGPGLQRAPCRAWSSEGSLQGHLVLRGLPSGPDAQAAPCQGQAAIHGKVPHHLGEVFFENGPETRYALCSGVKGGPSCSAGHTGSALCALRGRDTGFGVKKSSSKQFAL